MISVHIRNNRGQILASGIRVDLATLRARLATREPACLGVLLPSATVVVEVRRGGGDWDGRVVWRTGADQPRGVVFTNRKRGYIGDRALALLDALAAPA